MAPRFIASARAARASTRFVLLEDVLRHYLPRLYHGFEILSCHAIRVTRDADFLIPRRRDEDLLGTIEQGVRERRMGDAVRLQYDPDLPSEIVDQAGRRTRTRAAKISIPARASRRLPICFNSTPRSMRRV